MKYTMKNRKPAPSLHIITRCTRPEYLLKVKESVFKTSKWNEQVYWTIIFDTRILNNLNTNLLKELLSDRRIRTIYRESIEGDMGHQLINEVIDEKFEHWNITPIDWMNEWIYILDDDNKLHEDFLDSTFELIHANPECACLIFSQFVGGQDFSGVDIRVADPSNVKVGKIDMAQFLVKSDILNEIRFVSNRYEADGIFIVELYNKYKDRFIFDKTVLSYYNHFRKKTLPYSLPRIFVSGQNVGQIKSNKHSNAEADDLYVINTHDKSLLHDIYEHDPDCYITIGKNFSEFPLLSSLPFDFRGRWIHLENSNNVGEIAYNCSMQSILNHDTSTLISVFTPVHNIGNKIYRTYESLNKQSYPNWEWSIVDDSTDGITSKLLKHLAEHDPRIKIHSFENKTKGIIGEAKYRACVLSRGAYLLELDHDDYLLPDALELMLKAFESNENAGFVYSDCAEIDENFNTLKYGEGFALGYGKYRTETHLGKTFEVAIAPNINPLTIRHIVGVPNHFRAWKRDTYFTLNGHNRRLSIADDYELIVRTFLETHIVKIQRCCYLQFFHSNNSQDSTRADIQRRVRSISLNYSNQIRNRFEELGKTDWAYENSIATKPRYGEEECYVNSIIEVWSILE